MAVAAQYSYHYRIRWDTQPQVVLSGEFGVGPNPRLVAGDRRLLLVPEHPGAWPFAQLEFPLPPEVKAGDECELRCTPLNAHRSLSWWCRGELQWHLGHLPSLSGSRVGSALLEIVNEFDVDECLALYQRSWSQRLRPGQSGNLGDYHFRLRELNGLVTGSSYRAPGWLGLTRYPPELLEHEYSRCYLRADQGG